MHLSDKSRLETLALTAVEMARTYGAISRRYFRTDLLVESKSDNSPVTIADKETELALRSEIQKRFPGHGIVGEEYGNIEAKDDEGFTWVLDPIDGTKSFIAGIPLYTMLIALLRDGEPVFGLIHQPVSNEMLWAANGLGAWIDGKPARVSTTKALTDAKLILTDPTMFCADCGSFADRLIRSVKYSRSWGDGYGYLLVATGRADVMVDPRMNLWDVAPMRPILTEAGGRLTTITGKEALGADSLATNGLLHEHVLALHKS